MFNLLVIVTSDPATSHRPAEAARMAAGLGAWGKVRVRLYLDHSVVASLSDPESSWVDADVLRQYLPQVDTEHDPIWVPPGTGDLAGALGIPLRFESMTLKGLARLAAESRAVFTF